jgi:hypothetical protein
MWKTTAVGERASFGFILFIINIYIYIYIFNMRSKRTVRGYNTAAMKLRDRVKENVCEFSVYDRERMCVCVCVCMYLYKEETS